MVMTPIFVLTPTGRTGTTLLMSFLNMSPSIVLEDRYPYEAGLLQKQIATMFQNHMKPDPVSDPLVYYTSLADAQHKDASYVAEKWIGLICQNPKASVTQHMLQPDQHTQPPLHCRIF